MPSGKEVVQEDIFKSKFFFFRMENDELSYISQRISCPEKEESAEQVFTYQRGPLFSISYE